MQTRSGASLPFPRKRSLRIFLGRTGNAFAALVATLSLATPMLPADEVRGVATVSA
jgi:hypothetical protein